MNCGIERDLTERIAKYLGGIEDFKGDRVAFIPEDLGSVENEVTKAGVTTSGLAVVIAVGSFARTSDSAAAMSGDLDLSISVFEVPKANRKNPSAMTGQTANELIRNRLHWQAFDGIGRLRFVDYVRLEDGNFFVWESRWRVAVGADEASWGAGETAFGVVRTKRLVRAGTQVSEYDGCGDEFLSGVRDRHLEVDLTCYSNGAEPPDLGETFRLAVRGVEVEFRCTASDDSVDAEGVATLHLAGRTAST